MEENHELRKKVGSQLKAARLKAGLTYTQMAEITGLNRSTLCQIENGKWSASIDMIERIIKPLNLDVNIDEKASPE